MKHINEYVMSKESTLIAGWKFRLKVLVVMLILIPVGFYTKFYTGCCRIWVNNSLGGVLYEIFWCLAAALVFAKIRPFVASVCVFIITCILEFMQLWHPTFLELMRSTFLGSALLGTTFVWSDFPYYVIGSAIGGWVIYLLQRGPDSYKKTHDAGT